MSSENMDLPLSSLKSDYKVEHYQIRLDCQLEQHCFFGEVYVFLTYSGPGSLLVLDIKDLLVTSVEEIEATEEEICTILSCFEQRKNHQQLLYWGEKKSKHSLTPILESWCVKIEIPKRKRTVVLFQYETKPEGCSVSWFLDDDGNECCLTTGSLVNNRTLLPCQDAPTLMATWQLLLKVPEGFNAITTGDDVGHVTSAGNYFYTTMLLPISTLAIAIGKWQCTQIVLEKDGITPDDRFVECRHTYYPCPYATADLAGPTIPCRVFHSSSINPSILQSYLPTAIETVYRVLGRHVIPKLDFIIIPQTVACLGFASPGLILISPSVLYGRTPMLSRIGHEISHSWFGINIGPKNWGEEWISEGFATFMEDAIDLKMSKFAHKRELLALKAFNRYQILKSDCNNVDPSLQCAGSQGLSAETDVVVNGLNPAKMVSQIPYLKGYFFLTQVANIVGLDHLLVSLRKYVEHFHGCLVTTAECVDFFARNLQQNEQVLHQAHIWLHSTSFPDITHLLTYNRLDAEVAQHVEFWKRPTRMPPSFRFQEAIPDQVLALLDRLLELDIKLSATNVRNLVQHYEPHLINADVYHRACELIIMGRCSKFLHIVRNFLLHHPAMGAYLYGELMLSNRSQFKSVANEVYDAIENKLDISLKEIIKNLLSR